MFLKELMLVRQTNQKFVIFVTMFQPYVYNRCHDLLIIFMNLRNIVVLKIKNADYRCIITGVSKSEAIKLLQNIDLTEKKWNIIKIKSNSDTKFNRHSNLMKKWKIIN